VSKSFAVGMLLHDDMVAIDHIAPLTVFKLLGAQIHLVARTPAPVSSDVGANFAPNCSFADCPAALDLLFVPGGMRGTIAAMRDPATVAFVADRGMRARYAASVCTGSLLLGVAGLLAGYRATSHWYTRHLVPLFGAEARHERVVIDRNRITAGGATAGMDMALAIGAELCGEAAARHVQLILEYDPRPPFDAGSPEAAGPAAVAVVLARRQPLIDEARAAIETVFGEAVFSEAALA